MSERKGHRAPVRALLPLGQNRLVSGDDAGQLLLWRDDAVVATVEGTPVVALAWFAGHIVSAHADGKVRLWSAALQPLGMYAYPGKPVALSAHGERLALGFVEVIVIVDPAFRTLRKIAVARVPHDLQFSPDGRTLAAGTWFRLSLWDVDSGVVRSIPTEHNGLITALSYSPDGRYLATLGRHTDSALRLYATTDYTVVDRLQAHELCGSALRFSPDGRTLVSASDDESVRFYRIDPARYSSNGATPSAH